MNQEERALLDKFEDFWNFELGALFECPSRKQLTLWLKISGWDFALLEECIADLWSRARSPLSPEDPYGHALRHFSAALIRKTRAKYGMVRPKLREAA